MTNECHWSGPLGFSGLYISTFDCSDWSVGLPEEGARGSPRGNPLAWGRVPQGQQIRQGPKEPRENINHPTQEPQEEGSWCLVFHLLFLVSFRPSGLQAWCSFFCCTNITYRSLVDHFCSYWIVLLSNLAAWYRLGCSLHVLHFNFPILEWSLSIYCTDIWVIWFIWDFAPE